MDPNTGRLVRDLALVPAEDQERYDRIPDEFVQMAAQELGDQDHVRLSKTHELTKAMRDLKAKKRRAEKEARRRNRRKK